MTNKPVFHFIVLFDSLIRSAPDLILKGKLYHEFDMTQDQDGNRGFHKSNSGLVFESFYYLDVAAAPLIAIIASDSSFQGSMSQHPVYLRCCMLQY